MPVLVLKRALRNLHCKRISTLTDASFSVPTTSHKLLIESWITRISSLAQVGSGSEHALLRASELLNFAATEDSTGHALVHLIRASTDLGLESYCRKLHCYVIKCGLTSDVLVSTALMRFYGAMKLIGVAHHVFDEITVPNVVSWNTLISGYVRSGQFKQALGLFLQLECSEVCSDAYSLTAALSACGQLGMLQFGRSVHCKIVKDGFECGVFVPNCLIDMYGKCGWIEEAIRVFNGMVEKDTISWNSIIAASGRNSRLDLASSFFLQMPQPDTVSYNELINGIAQFGHIEEAVEILSTMPNPNSSSWNSILTGYVNRNRSREAMEFFTMMHSSNVGMDEYTYSSLLSGIASLAALRWGTVIHCCIVKRGLSTRVVVGSSMIDMYAKCGEVSNADSIFRSLPHKNLVTWNAIIAGYAQGGDSEKVIQLFEELKKAKGLHPDWITYLNVLASCSNARVPLETATRYFESMINDHGIIPSPEHCCSMIRLLGQNGEVRSTLRMIYDFRFGSCGVVWRALLGACGTCANSRVAKIAAAKVIELEGDDDYVYVMLSNIFASCGKWGDVKKVRNLMWKNRVAKEVGCSWI